MTMSQLRYKRTSETLHTEIGDDVVALHVRAGHCYGMENVTADVWRLLEHPITLAKMCEELAQRYDVDDETCNADVRNLIQAMEREELVEVVREPAGPSPENGHE